jgi:acyl carrier protein
MSLPEIPLTPNGKLDRKALPAPDHTRPETQDSFAEPSTALEKALADIWIEMLELDRVSVHDNFFELGGHSLLAMSVIGRLRKEFGIDLQLRAFLELPTIAELAAMIIRSLTEQGGDEQIVEILEELEQMQDREPAVVA